MLLKTFMMIILAVMPLRVTLEAGFFDFFSRKNSETPVPPYIDILLVQDRPGAVIEVKGPYKLYDPIDNSYVSTRFSGKRRFIQALQDGLKWGEEFPGLYQLLIVPESKNVTTMIDGIEYQGATYVYDVEGKIGVVNEIDIEDYLQSILSSPYYRELPNELLAAIAITARTNAFYNHLFPKTLYWGIQASDISYKGSTMVNRSTPMSKAINNTRYLIVSRSKKDEDPRPFQAKIEKDGNKNSWAITIEEAVAMANNGAKASEILAKAFPGTQIVSNFKG